MIFVGALEGYYAFRERVGAKEMLIGDRVDIRVRIARYYAEINEVANWFIGQPEMNPLMKVGW
ncbi:hypothetical protein GCT13_39065 [Paraburkholderia sp. CNPSo 3157]|uniref:Uncharacterized protein n=1 Tax=Paraburkholderia franconis TaxID=2654983 RepID=A0A7X1NIV2_9BURK|nr:hypothetical protein [Paraburkholderia franconis]MPW22657.1 hypothetical protein [Paraburkholderia franconis]